MNSTVGRYQRQSGSVTLGIVKVLFQIGFVAALLSGVAAGMAAEVAYNDRALFPISVRDKYGTINRTGDVVIAPEYDEPIVMREGLARVRKGPRVAYLDASGKRVIEPRYQWATEFRNGLAWVGEPKQRGGMYVDKQGVAVWRSAD